MQIYEDQKQANIQQIRRFLAKASRISGRTYDEYDVNALFSILSESGTFRRSQPTQKLFLMASHQPSASLNDKGFWERLQLVPFSIASKPGRVRKEKT